MSDIAGDWAGKILGTNNADIFVEIAQQQRDLTGTVGINDPMYGAAVYDYKGTFEDGQLYLEMDPSPQTIRQSRSHTAVVNGQRVVQTDVVSFGHVSITGKQVEAERIEGKWTSSIGTGGAFWISRATSRVETASNPELRVDVSATRFIESDSVPRDAEVVDRTWKYVNKSGGPDRRFKDNKELPICRYEEIALSSQTGLNEVLQLSRCGSGGEFAKAISLLGKKMPKEGGGIAQAA